MQNNIQRFALATLIATLYSTPLFAADADEQVSALNDQKDVAVTIYNENLALVKDQRITRLKSGISKLALKDVSAQIQPETAILRSISAPGSLAVIEQNFDFDLLTPEKLLEKYVGKSVGVIRTNPATGQETQQEAQVLAANGGVVLKIGSHIETGVPGRIIYPNVPDNLRERPTLVTQLSNQGDTDQTIELSYLTGGLSWKADYVAELDTDEQKLDLSAWVTLSNTSGASYQNAKLQLVAGDVNRVHDQRVAAVRMLRKNEMVMDAVAAAPMAEESLLEYHLYSLNRPTTIADNQTKQVSLLSAAAVPVRKELVLRGADYYYQSSYGDLGQKLKPGVFLEFDNKTASKLGVPLPKGIIRVYKRDKSGNAQFVGEDRIDHTAKNETIRLKLGEAFDVTADKKQTDFKKLPNPAKGSSFYESAYEITLKNAKKERITVTVQEPVPGDWVIIKENSPSSRPASNTAQWKVDIPAEGKAILNYRVQVKY